MVVLTPMDMDLVDLVVVDEVVTLTLDLILVQMELVILVVEEAQRVLVDPMVVQVVPVSFLSHILPN